MTLTAPSLAASLAALAPAVAHDGHPHLGNEIVHHTLEGLVVAVAIVVLGCVAFRLRARRQHDEASRSTPNL